MPRYPDWGDRELYNVVCVDNEPPLTPEEEEAIWDEQESEREEDEWLASWSDDFHSDEWLNATGERPQ